MLTALTLIVLGAIIALVVSHTSLSTAISDAKVDIAKLKADAAAPTAKV